MKPTEIEVTIHLDDDTSVTITADGKRPANAVSRVLAVFTVEQHHTAALARAHDDGGVS